MGARAERAPPLCVSHKFIRRDCISDSREKVSRTYETRIMDAVDSDLNNEQENIIIYVPYDIYFNLLHTRDHHDEERRRLVIVCLCWMDHLVG